MPNLSFTHFATRDLLLILGPQALESAASPHLCSILACLPLRRIITLTDGANQGWVSALAAWRQAGRLVQVLDLNGEPPQLDESQVTWLNLPLDHPPDRPWLHPLLRVWLASHSACLLGCHPEQIPFQQHLRASAWASGQEARQHFTFSPLLTESQAAAWEELNVRVISAEPLEWANTLAENWRAAEESTTASVSQPNHNPYRLLEAYQETDQTCFFGREADIRALCDQVLAAPLTVCFGPSGVGKTSLLQAGLMTRLRRLGYLPLYARPAGSALAALHRSVSAALAHPAASQASLAETLTTLGQRDHARLVLILDQAEEIFTQESPPAAQALGQTLADCLRLPGVSVHILLALRQDYLAHLHTFQNHLPGIFTNRCRIKPFERTQAQQAITAPAHLAGLAYEDTLLEELLDDLQAGGETVEPADLQMVCSALYADLLEQGATRFTLDRYQALGRTTHLLARYLEGALAASGNPGEARAIFKALVTTLGVKIPLQAAEIARLCNLPSEQVSAHLQSLETHHRLLRRLPGEAQPLYELAHEVLGPHILTWVRDPQEQAARQARDLLRAELAAWQRFQVLPGPGKLQVIHAERDNPHLHLNQVEIELLLRAALAHSFEADYWLERAAQAGLPPGDYVLAALDAPQAATRRQALELLGPQKALAELRRRLKGRHTALAQKVSAVELLGQVQNCWNTVQAARHARQEPLRRQVWETLQTVDERRAARLRRQDEMLPLLAAGTLLGILHTAIQLPDWLTLFTVGCAWLLSLQALYQLVPRLPGRLLNWSGGLIALMVCIAQGGWQTGAAIWALLFLLGGGLRQRPHLAWGWRCCCWGPPG
jgi:hypothetical protein